MFVQNVELLYSFVFIILPSYISCFLNCFYHLSVFLSLGVPLGFFSGVRSVSLPPGGCYRFGCRHIQYNCITLDKTCFESLTKRLFYLSNDSYTVSFLPGKGLFTPTPLSLTLLSVFLYATLGVD
ncbi:unnamed protein product [Meganyctiphanes norvegica]|uniref:Uncharacterized protein n=1 Tax=Meganyctiphanes norvegica TaxID=48144 RepID=A0AAV2R8F4_MEGNR